MSFFRRLFDVAQYLSLDVVVGGVLFANSLAYVFDSTLSFRVSSTLACGIWLIYTLDHLMDARNVKDQPHIKRHAFHKKYRRPIAVLFVLIALIGLWQLAFLPRLVLVSGGVLSGLVGLYFSTIWFFKMFFAKELFVAVLYSSGIFLGVVSNVGGVSFTIAFLFIQTVILTSINLLLFSLNEVNLDNKDGHCSWVTYFGVRKTNHHFWCLIVLAVVFLLFGMVNYLENRSFFLLQLIFLGMFMVLFFIYRNPNWFGKKERFRWVGDAVFLFPGLVYLF